MNIAIVHAYPVHAAAVGGTTRLYALARYLAGQHHRVSVFTHADETGQSTIDPELDRLGVTRRTFPRLRAGVLQKAGRWLGADPYYVAHNANPALASALAAADAAQPFDAIHLELGYLAPLTSRVHRDVIRVLAEQEAMPPALERLRTLPASGRTPYERLAVHQLAKARRFDAATLPMFDLIYGITPDESRYLSQAAARPVEVLPHVVDLSRFQGRIQGRDASADSQTVLFVGNFAHRPNVHGVLWFAEHVWPDVKRTMPHAQFEVVGRMPASLRNVLVRHAARPMGYQADLAACYRDAAVVITPVHSGGGMRGKVLEAFASARALVSTPLGLEGIAATPGTHCACAADPASFAEAVIAYLRDPNLRRAHGRAARALVAERYDAPVVFTQLEHDLEQAIEQRRGSTTKRRVG